MTVLLLKVLVILLLWIDVLESENMKMCLTVHCLFKINRQFRLEVHICSCDLFIEYQYLCYAVMCGFD